MKLHRVVGDKRSKVAHPIHKCDQPKGFVKPSSRAMSIA